MAIFLRTHKKTCVSTLVIPGPGECLVREPSLGPTAAQSQALPFGGSALAQSRSLPHKQRVTFDDSAGPSVHLQGRRMTIMIPWFLLPL